MKEYTTTCLSFEVAFYKLLKILPSFKHAWCLQQFSRIFFECAHRIVSFEYNIYKNYCIPILNINFTLNTSIFLTRHRLVVLLKKLPN